MKKSVSFNEDLNEIKYYEKEIIDNTEDYLSTVLKYCCSRTNDDDDEKGPNKKNNDKDNKIVKYPCILNDL